MEMDLTHIHVGKKSHGFFYRGRLSLGCRRRTTLCIILVSGRWVHSDFYIRHIVTAVSKYGEWRF